MSVRRSLFVLLALLAVGVVSSTTAADQPARPTSQEMRAALSDPGRAVRERAVARIREWALTDPAAPLALGKDLPVRARALLVRAVASAGTKVAAAAAMQATVGADDAVFASLIRGLVTGGGRALRAATPSKMSDERREHLRALRLRWKVELEMARLKSLSGITGHYTNQYRKLKGLGQEILPIFFAMVRDDAYPLPGETGAGRYESIHPWMQRFDRYELRTLAAYAFGELTDKNNIDIIAQLVELFGDYFRLRDKESNRFERDDVASAIAFSLFDLGVKGPANQYIARKENAARGRPSMEVFAAYWDLGYAYIRTGRPRQGELWYKRLINRMGANSKAVASYNLACMWSKECERRPKNAADYKQKSIMWLHRAVHEFGYADWIWMEEDKDLDSIRKELGYKRILQHLKNKYPDTARRKVSKKLEEFLSGEDDDK